MIVSFAHVGIAQRYVRPELSSALMMEEARHPILDRTKHRDEVVANDIYVPSDACFLMVTGRKYGALTHMCP